MRRAWTCLLASVVLASPALAAGEVEVSAAWTPAGAQKGAEHPLYLTVENKAGEPDELVRLRCPVAHFSEKRTTDYGEGAPHAREVKSVPIPAGETLELKPGAYHLVLLQMTQELKEGETFSCTFSFKNAGSKKADVKVAAEGAQAAP